MLIIVAGMPRSGSTYSFNIARELLAARGSVATSAAADLPPGEVTAATDHFVYKVHNPSGRVLQLVATGAARGICTYRKPEDAVASWHDTFGFTLDESIAAVRSWIGWHREHAGAFLNLAYESIEQDPLGAALQVQDYLLGATDRQEAERLADTYSRGKTFEQVSTMVKSERTVDLGFSYYDATTFYHRRHVRAAQEVTAAQTLSPPDLDRVRTALLDVVDADGAYRPPA